MVSKYGGKYLQEGDNSNHVEFMAKLMSLPRFDPKDEKNLDLLKKHINSYLSICQRYDCKVTQANFALSLHISRLTLQNWLSGQTHLPSAVREVLVEVNNMLAAQIEDGILDGTVNVVGGIFIGKNNFGYKDSSEQVVVHEDRRLSIAELQKIANQLPDVIDVTEDSKLIETDDDNKSANT